MTRLTVVSHFTLKQNHFWAEVVKGAGRGHRAQQVVHRSVPLTPFQSFLPYSLRFLFKDSALGFWKTLKVLWGIVSRSFSLNIDAADVASEQFLFEIQYDLPGRELLRNSSSHL